MATGYTHKVQDGTITEFRDFALDCARAFGALITMRDDPGDVPIPERFEPDTKYYDGALERAQKTISELSVMTIDQAAKEAAAEHRDAVKVWNERNERRNVERLRYKSMIEKVSAWMPPSVDHENMKAFMLEQLRDSMRFDCDSGYDTPPVPLTGTEWLSERLAQASRDAVYHTEQRAREIERVDNRNLWVKQLRDSLS